MNGPLCYAISISQRAEVSHPCFILTSPARNHNPSQANLGTVKAQRKGWGCYAALGRVRELGGEEESLGMAALMWISQAERPLKSLLSR